LCVVYFGDLSPGAKFDVNQLGGFVIQVKNKSKSASPKERDLPPTGIPRDLDKPLPYLTCILELGNDSRHQDTKTKIKATVPEAPSPGRLRELTGDLLEAQEALQKYLKNPAATNTKIAELEEDVRSKRLLVERYYRYSVFVRGASAETYGILNEAGIAIQFGTLLSVTMPPPALEESAMQHMKPSLRLDEASPHTAWMWD